MPATQTLDLAKLIFDRIEGIGVPAAAALFKTTQTAIKKWQGGTAEPGVTACQIILDEALAAGDIEVDAFLTPPEQGETKPPAAPVETPQRATTETDELGDVGNNGRVERPAPKMAPPRKASFLIPINRDMSYAVVLSMLGNWKSTLPEELRAQLASMDFEPDTTPHNSRNILATRFVAGGNEWSFWQDSDIIASIGNPAWFKRRTGSKHADKWFAQSAFERLTSRGKSIVGGVYIQRSPNGRIVAQPGLSPSGELDARVVEEVKAGPQDKVIQVGYVGFGCVAVHRKVFEDILKTQPGIRGEGDKPHAFFNPIEGGPQGEDIAFCKRAAEAGHPTFLDLSLHCGHVGKFAYMP
jgi:hypothetical protein